MITTLPNPVETAVRNALREMGSVLVALSGGVDSSVLAALAFQELGDNAAAATGVSASLATQELADIRSFCAERGITHFTVTTGEMSVPGYVENSPERCYFCKNELFGKLAELAARKGHACVVDGTTAEDLHGHRPGKRAADENGIRSPLIDAGATKEDVRIIARRLNLAVAERPASPCLSSRIAYGVPITSERLARVGRAEASLRALGFSNLRVRLHDNVARIEVPKSDLSRAVTHAERIHAELKDLGFVYVTLDLAGLRSGSLLEVLPTQHPQPEPPQPAQPTRTK